MAKSELDKFNEEESSESKPKNVNWNEGNAEIGMEAACAICDALFTATADRPPIFCPNCKQGLAEILQL